MFYKSQFNGDISKWDISNVTNMSNMFENSQFNSDISKWDVSSVTNMEYMFYNSQYNGDISNWNVSNVTDMGHMFSNSQFNGDLSKWDISRLEYGRAEIIKLYKKKQSIEEGYKECPVTGEFIKGDYFKCATCRHCFDIQSEKWIDEHKKCPLCRSNWKDKIIYSQP
jgi:surface protein